MHSKIKVLQLGSPSGLYGAERWILALIRHLDPGAVETWVASVKDAPGFEVPLCLEANKMGFRTHIFDCVGKINLSAISQLRAFIIENGIDVVHTHGYKTDAIGLLATRGTSCKIVSTPHGWTKQPDLKLRMYELAIRAFFPFMDAVAPLSDELHRSLANLPGLKRKLRLIENAVDIDEITVVKDVSEDISGLKEEGKLVIGYIGRLTAGKGLDVLLNAVAGHGEPDWHVAIVGEGEQNAELQNMTKSLGILDRVTFFGFRPDRLSFLKGFDIFVLPSRSEGIPRCLMEAMTAGVPVIASDIPGCRYLVDGKTTGLLFTSDQPHELSEAIKSLASDTSLRNELVISAREFINRKFSAARMAAEYEELYASICGKSICLRK